MKVCFPPEVAPASGTKIFLAGSIEMNLARHWQGEVTSAVAHTDLILLNPRRKDWNSSWRQDLDQPEFVEQVNWELQGLEEADLIVMYLDPNTKSPISLLELGLHAHTGKLVVCCPKGFWRRGNVQLVCARYGVPMVDDIDGLIKHMLSLKV